MRCTILLSLVLLTGCNDNSHSNSVVLTDTLKMTADTPVADIKPITDIPLPKTYANARFKDVIVQRTGKDTFLVRGQGQIFEANFGWVVEDGHNELKKGHQMTDAGAPAWGKFEFTITVKKERENSTLTLILFETSAKDGSRQFELPMALN